MEENIKYGIKVTMDQSAFDNSISKMISLIEKGVIEATSSLNKLSQEIDNLEAKFVELGDVVSISFTSKFTESGSQLESVTSSMEENIINVAKIAQGLALNEYATLAKGIISLADGNVALASALTGASVAVGAYTLAQKALESGVASSTISLKFLNDTISISPTAIFAIAVGALAAGIVALCLSFEQEKSKLELSTEAAKEAIEEHKKLAEEADKVAQAGATEADGYGKLKKELDSLVESNGKVKEGYEDRAQFIVKTLSEATGKEISMVDGVISNYGELSQEIDTLISKMRAKAILEAHEGEYKEAITNQTEALKKLTVAQDELHKKESERSAFIEKYKNNNPYASEQENMKVAEQAWDNYVQKYKDNVNSLSDEYQGYTTSIRDYEQASADFITGNYEDINKTLAGTNEAYASSLEEKQSIIQANSEQEIVAIQELYKQKDQMSEEQFNHELENHQRELAENQNKLFALTEQTWGNSELYAEAMAYLSEQGAAAYDENGNLTEAAQMKIDLLRLKTTELIPQYSEALMEMANSGQAVFDLNGELTTAAQNKLLNTYTSMNGLMTEYANILTTMANQGEEVFNANGSLTEGAQQKLIDTYAKMNELSSNYSEILRGMVDNGEVVFDNNGDLTEAAKSKLQEAAAGAEGGKELFLASLRGTATEGKDEIAKADTKDAGSNFIEGARQGANDKKSNFLNVISGIASAGLRVLTSIWDEHSPSKATRKIGDFFVEGLTLGLKDKKDEFVENVNEMGIEAVDELESMVSDASDTLQSNSITPEIGLKLNTIFQIKDILRPLEDAVMHEQLRMNATLNSSIQHEILKASHYDKQQPLFAKLEGKIENRISIDGRETAIQLAPLISEELEFQGR